MVQWVLLSVVLVHMGEGRGGERERARRWMRLSGRVASLSFTTKSSGVCDTLHWLFLVNLVTQSIIIGVIVVQARVALVRPMNVLHSRLRYQVR